VITSDDSRRPVARVEGDGSFPNADGTATTDGPARGRRQARLAILLTALGFMLFKLWVAAHTIGTDDVHAWVAFAQGVADFGPIGLYGHPVFFLPYNHPPLAGYLLVAINWLVAHGVGSVPFLIRVPASVADVATALLVFELLTPLRSLRQATWAGLLVAASPVTCIISGFHGNTDPVMVALTLASVHALTQRSSQRSAALAGAAFAAAISIKLVPVIVAPTLALAAWFSGRRRFLAFAAAFCAFIALTWAPVALYRWHEFSQNVLGYRGVWRREWGLVQFAKWLHLPRPFIGFLTGAARFPILIIASGLPVLLLWRRRERLGAAVGLAFASFLLLSPAFGMQYLVWPLASAFLISFWLAAAYDLVASVFMIMVYNQWNKDVYPWHWNEAWATGFRTEHFVMAVLTWAVLAALVGAGALSLRSARSPRQA
jgi:dolichyl-phosphate-mannose-protein mannosyltransferase